MTHTMPTALASAAGPYHAHSGDLRSPGPAIGLTTKVAPTGRQHHPSHQGGRTGRSSAFAHLASVRLRTAGQAVLHPYCNRLPRSPREAARLVIAGVASVQNRLLPASLHPEWCPTLDESNPARCARVVIPL